MSAYLNEDILLCNFNINYIQKIIPFHVSSNTQPILYDIENVFHGFLFNEDPKIIHRLQHDYSVFSVFYSSVISPIHYIYIYIIFTFHEINFENCANCLTDYLIIS